MSFVRRQRKKCSPSTTPKPTLHVSTDVPLAECSLRETEPAIEAPATPVVRVAPADPRLLPPALCNLSSSEVWIQFQRGLNEKKRFFILQGPRGCGKSFGVQTCFSHMNYCVHIIDLVVEHHVLKKILHQTLGSTILTSSQQRAIIIDDIDDLESPVFESILTLCENSSGTSIALTCTAAWKLFLKRRRNGALWTVLVLPAIEEQDVRHICKSQLATTPAHPEIKNLNQLFLQIGQQEHIGSFLDHQRDRFIAARMLLTSHLFYTNVDPDALRVVQFSGLKCAQTIENADAFCTTVSLLDGMELDITKSNSLYGVFSHALVLAARTHLNTIGRYKGIMLQTPPYLTTTKKRFDEFSCLLHKNKE